MPLTLEDLVSMSSYVVGFRPPDERWRQMKAVWDACKAARIAPPSHVEQFFNGQPPDEAGVEINLRDTPCCTEYRAEMREGYQIDVTKLPPDVRIIRFVNSY